MLPTRSIASTSRMLTASTVSSVQPSTNRVAEENVSATPFCVRISNDPITKKIVCTPFCEIYQATPICPNDDSRWEITPVGLSEEELKRLFVNSTHNPRGNGFKAKDVITFLTPAVEFDTKVPKLHILSGNPINLSGEIERLGLPEGTYYLAEMQVPILRAQLSITDKLKRFLHVQQASHRESDEQPLLGPQPQLKESKRRLLGLYQPGKDSKFFALSKEGHELKVKPSDFGIAAIINLALIDCNLVREGMPGLSSSKPLDISIPSSTASASSTPLRARHKSEIHIQKL